jgi:methylenetetrahydrofolate dehydrogenase (NADP+)/methenyltetrahydrofolate cyclohydrolase
MRAELPKKVSRLKQERGITPGLMVILVGNDPASEVYVKNKAKKAKEAGMRSEDIRLPASTSQAELLAAIDRLNRDPGTHGILVQLPLPSHIDKNAILFAIDPAKDVDGFHPENVRKLERGEKGFVPCTPLGCLMLLKDYFSPSPSMGEGRGGGGENTPPSLTLPHKGGGDLTGLRAVVVGRSPIVGKPMAELLRQQGCEVNVIHSQTTPQERAKWLSEADIVVAAVGKPHLIGGRELKPGVVVIDVGINRVPGEGGKSKLVGDVDFESCRGVAAAITPVPGGVGPMTIACLLENTFTAAASSSL